MKKPRRGVIVDAVALEAPGLREGTAVAMADLLREGTRQEVLEALEWVGLRLCHADGDLPPEVRQWLGAALLEIASGKKSPEAALRITTKLKIGITAAKGHAHMVDDLTRQGLTKTAAQGIVGRLNMKTEKPHLMQLDVESARDKTRKRTRGKK
ncbi:MAG: hypothetical protein BroJett006_26710 [Betaproteobacteria bacterium]|nr:MAG: hypothetical protein BroJett006_26710 [Betaproteobacteria bacterium]